MSIKSLLSLFSAEFIPIRNITMCFVKYLWTWSVIKFCMTSRWAIYLKRFIIHDYFKPSIHWMFLLKSNKESCHACIWIIIAYAELVQLSKLGCSNINEKWIIVAFLNAFLKWVKIYALNLYWLRGMLSKYHILSVWFSENFRQIKLYFNEHINSCVPCILLVKKVLCVETFTIISIYQFEIVSVLQGYCCSKVEYKISNQLSFYASMIQLTLCLTNRTLKSKQKWSIMSW